MGIVFSHCSLLRELERGGDFSEIETPSFLPYDGLKRQLVVLDFTDNTELGRGNAGGALASMIMSALQKSNRFVLVDKSSFLPIDSLRTPEFVMTVSKDARIHAILSGEIIKLDYDYGRKEVESEEDKWGVSLMASFGRVSVSMNVYEPCSGEILFSKYFSEEVIKPGFSIRTKEFDFQNEVELDETVIGQVLRRVAYDIAMSLVQNVELVKWYGKVIKIKNDSLYFTPGYSEGVVKGDLFYFCDSLQQKKSGFNAIRVIGFLNEKISIALLSENSMAHIGDWIVEGEK